MKNLFKSLAIALLVVSCGTSSIRLDVLRPANLNLTKYKNVAFQIDKGPTTNVTLFGKDVENPEGYVIDNITEKLTNDKSLEVIDAANIPEDKKAQTLLIKIRSVKLKFKTKRDSERVKSKDGDYTRYTTNLRMDNIFNMKIARADNGKILHNKRYDYSRNKSESSTLEYPEFDRESVFAESIQEFGPEYMKNLLPYMVTVWATFEDDELFQKDLDAALAMIKSQQTEDGINKLVAIKDRFATAKAETKAKSIYNLATIKIYTGQPEEAIDLLKEAIRIMPESSRYTSSLREAKAEKAKKDKLLKQQEEAAAAE